MPKIYFVGVDVGTSSARAALVTSQGEVVKQHSQKIQIWNPQPDHYEQSSDDIWNSVCECVREVTSEVSSDEIVAISFDATCSLVVLGEYGRPITVSSTGSADQNVILWMDHRAQAETDAINATNHEILKYVGGQVSLEMEIPKLIWLKKHMYISTWSKIWRTFDLPDFLTWRATGFATRSLCSVVCKWNYDAVKNQWCSDFLEEIGLDDLCENNFEIIGREILKPGEPVGRGLNEKAANELNLNQGTFVGASLIDAHAGALGMFGCKASDDFEEIEGKLALICGTSTCHMSLTQEPCWSKGIWGPYQDAIIPNFYLNEAGQSAAGVLLDHVVQNHPKYADINSKLKSNEHIYSYLNDILEIMTVENNLSDVCYLTKDIHIWPDFHGNRSPLSDPSLRGMISGLSMKNDEDELAILYLATMQSLAYGTKHIIESLMADKRRPFKSLLFCGGLAKNNVYVQAHADICDIQAIVPREQEMVLVGAAMLGACASKVYPSLESASQAMGGRGDIMSPKTETFEFHKKKYKVYKKMLEDQRSYREIMKNC